MDFQLIITFGLFSVAVVIAVIVARRSGGGIVDTATQLVIDAENLIKPQAGETWDAANARKLQYVLDKLNKAYPDVDTTHLRNIIEAAVSIFKGRLVKKA